MTRSVLAQEISPDTHQHPHWALVTRVASSQCFHSSSRTREFLLYVADCALRNAPDEATEQHIGIHVFHRAPGFNSSEDSIVRTQARSLRQKLTEYFATEGAHEEIVIEIPKGHYLPVFQPRQPSVIGAPPLTSASPAAHAPDETENIAAPKSRWRTAWLAGLTLGILAVVGLVYYLARPTAVDRFWAPFLSDNQTLIIYSNAIFTGDSTNGLRYASPDRTSQQLPPEDLVETYTGIGELASVYNLTRLFDRHHASFTLKRSLLVTWDEAKLNNLVFIGSVAENPSLRVLPSTVDFTMTTGNGFSGIVNHHPKPGEPSLYSRAEHPLVKDYAILALLPGLQEGKKILVFSGLTTLGTQAAVEFVCRKETVDKLLDGGVATGRKREIRPFEAVLETTIGGGVPLQTRLISLHVH